MESVEQLQPQRQVCPNSTLKAPYGGRSRAATEDNVVLLNFADAWPHRVAQAGRRDVSRMYQFGEHRGCVGLFGECRSVRVSPQLNHYVSTDSDTDQHKPIPPVFRLWEQEAESSNLSIPTTIRRHPGP